MKNMEEKAKEIWEKHNKIIVLSSCMVVAAKVGHDIGYTKGYLRCIFDCLQAARKVK
jgi:hypothetical protein